MPCNKGRSRGIRRSLGLSGDAVDLVRLRDAYRGQDRINQTERLGSGRIPGSASVVSDQSDASGGGLCTKYVARTNSQIRSQADYIRQ